MQPASLQPFTQVSAFTVETKTGRRIVGSGVQCVEESHRCIASVEITGEKTAFYAM